MTIRSILAGCLVGLVCGSLSWGQTPDALDKLERSLDPPLVGPAGPEATPDQAGYLGLHVDLQAPNGDAVFVVAVATGGPADKAGVRVDDVILSINDVPIRTLQDLDRAVRQPVGTKLNIQVRRGTATQAVEVTLAERPASPDNAETIGELPPPPPTGPVTKPLIEGRPTLGISVDDVSDMLRRRFGITTDHGAVITRIHEGSPAAKTGLPLGGVVVSVNNRRIASADDLVAVIQAFRPGDEIEITYFEGDRIGRKRIRLVPGAPADGAPPAVAGGAADRDDPPLRLGRRKPGNRPLLDALERTLDVVLPPVTQPGDAAGSAADSNPTPPPPPPAAGGDATAPADVDELPVPPPPPPMNLDPPATTTDPGDPFPSPKARDRGVQPPPPPAPGKRPAVKKDPQSVLVPPAPSDNSDAEVEAELQVLREQMKTLREQMEALQKKIDALEKKRGG